MNTMSLSSSHLVAYIDRETVTHCPQCQHVMMDSCIKTQQSQIQYSTTLKDSKMFRVLNVVHFDVLQTIRAFNPEPCVHVLMHHVLLSTEKTVCRL